MGMHLAKRVKRIIAGGLNAFVEAIEGKAPEVIMEQAIREVEGAIDEVREELGKLLASKHLANKRLAQINEEHEILSEKIDLAIQEQREDLAEAAIGRQLDIEAQVPLIEQTIIECSEREKELEGYIAALQGKKREMEQELQAFVRSHSTSTCGCLSEDSQNTSDNRIQKNISEAKAAFDRVLAKKTGVLPNSSSEHKNACQLAELEKLSREHRIKERLAAIKTSCANEQVGG